MARSTTLTVPGPARRIIKAMRNAARLLEDDGATDDAQLLTGIADRADEHNRALQTIARLRRLHSQRGIICNQCMTAWPCRTLKMLEPFAP